MKLTNKEAIAQLEQMAKLTHMMSPDNKFILACQHAIEVLKRFEGAFEVKAKNLSFEPTFIYNKVKGLRDYAVNYKLYAIPKENKE